MTSTTASGSATRWGPLWGSRARDWGANEEQQGPTYDEAIKRVGPTVGKRVLEVGCGTGVFLAAVAARGARPVGLDASEELIELARDRVPSAEVVVGDMQFLPFEDDSFDLVAGFNSFFFADDIVAALREAGRVARPGAPVVVQVWGRPEHCDLEAMKQVVRPYMSAPASAAPPPPPLWKPGVLEEIATEAGLHPREAFDISWAYEYPDDETLARCMLSVGGLASIVGPAAERELGEQVVRALAPYRLPSGAYRLENEWHFMLAEA